MRKLLLLATVAALTLPMATAAPAQRSNWSHQARTETGYTLHRSVMRAGPDRDYPVLRVIPNGRRVAVFGCLNDWSWCDISYRGDRGWISGRLVGADYRGQRRAFSSAGAYLGIGILTFVLGDYWDSYYRSRPFYSQRPQWERHYNQQYRPQWGPRPGSIRQPDHQTTTPDRDRQWNGQQMPGIGHNAPDDHNKNQALPGRPATHAPAKPPSKIQRPSHSETHSGAANKDQSRDSDKGTGHEQRRDENPIKSYGR